MLLEKVDARTAVEMIKDICKIDPLAAVQGIVVATCADLLETVIFNASSNEVVLKASFIEKDLLDNNIVTMLGIMGFL